jgi:predicted phosphodiesterase
VSAARSVAALYDIHGNLPALDAVLAELQRDPPDAVVIGGDVAAGPMPREVLGRLRALPWPVHWLRGNADRAVVMGFDGTIPPELLEHPLYAGDAWAATFLDRADRDFLAALPPLLALDLEGLGTVLFCHGTARSDEERVTTATPPERLARVLAEAGADVLVGGHTHRQFDRRAGGRRMVNAGSVGRVRAPAGRVLAAARAGRHARAHAYAPPRPTPHSMPLGYPAADLVFAEADPDEVTARYERASGEPVDPASANRAGENPLLRRAAADHR